MRYACKEQSISSPRMSASDSWGLFHVPLGFRQEEGRKEAHQIDAEGDDRSCPGVSRGRLERGSSGRRRGQPAGNQGEGGADEPPADVGGKTLSGTAQV